MKNKKSQTEILGVAVIVIILVVAGVFLIILRLRGDESASEGYIDPELADSFLNTLLNTKTEKGATVAQVIKDCYSNRNDLCGSSTTSNCCEYAHTTMTNALDATLKEWGRDYRLTVARGNDKRIPDIPENSRCDRYTQSVQDSYPIPPPPSIVVTLEICKV